MSLQTTIADAWRAIVHALAPGESTLANPAPWIGEAFQMSPSAAGKVVTPQTSMRVAAVYACVAVLSQSVGQLPLIFYKYGRDGSTEPALDHPLYPLLRHLPNPEVSSQDMREMAMLHLCLRGNAYHQIVRSGGQVTEINSLHPDYVRMYRGANGRLAYDYTPPNGGKVTLGDDEVWRITGMSFNGLNGLSPISYARESIGLSMATEEHGAKLFSNGAQIATAFEHPGVMSPEAQKRFQESIHSKYAGSHNAFKTIILEEGMKVAKLAMTSVDSQFIEARKYQLEEICRIYRVPPHKIQDLARATFNNIEHLSMDFVNSSLMPWLKKFEESINRDLLLPNERKKYFARFDVDSLQRGDMQARANYYASGIANTWFSPNEARAKEFLNPREGGDKFENPNTTAGATKPNEPIPDPQKG